MFRVKSVGLSAMYLAIAVLVSGTLVMAVRSNYLVDGRSPTVDIAIHRLQNA
ncbi:MAG TPA: hypothetical protein VL418_05320 [Devosiaceae bacterium]|jgi:hypothetical protein|nr:hypothetical protein [Devosiaceae bacterium]